MRDRGVEPLTFSTSMRCSTTELITQGIFDLKTKLTLQVLKKNLFSVKYTKIHKPNMLKHQTKNNIHYTEINPEARNILVLLHGWNTVGATSWENFLDCFRDKNIRIIAPDMPGFNRSKEPDKIWLVKDYSVWLNQFLDDLQIQEKVYLMGHSFGGAIASQFAVDYANKLKKIILVAPAIIREKTFETQKKLDLIQKISKFFKRIFEFSIFSIFYKPVRKVWYKIIGSPDYNKTTPKMAKIMQAVIQDDKQETVKKIKLPVLICWGTNDNYTPYSQSQKIKKLIQNSKLVTFHGINHGIHLHSTKELADTVFEFLKN